MGSIGRFHRPVLSRQMQAPILCLCISIAGCSSTSTRDVILVSVGELEQSTEYQLTEKIQDVKQAIQSMDQNWEDPAEAAHYANQIESLKKYLDMIQRMLASPFVYVDGTIGSLAPIHSLSEYQRFQLRLAQDALAAVQKNGFVRFENYIKVLVDVRRCTAVITFAADIPRGHFGPDFSLQVTLDLTTREVVHMARSA